MTRNMSGPQLSGGLLHGLHSENCDNGQEFVTCRPVVLSDERGQSERIEVLVMAWCGDCHCAEWDFV